ncbi:MAG TPA: 3-oxoacyl-ACP reductase [Anaerolineaceae bacterium]|uniref:Putative oxidoreductase n=1 Tax=Anaerolinea thermophila TaxID=167964 RepID=A0A117LGZ3_9CHLR|nr:MAG: Putative oxidoreductase [Anaerolinea thermophila]HAF61335.1 3-oxoacyl-ACP reductase [Anaerolineaceae bacterium]
MDLLLDGKIALVTGSSRGLGFATAKLLVQEGAIVIINGRDTTQLAKAKEGLDLNSHAQVMAVPGDVTDPSFADKVINEIQFRFGGLDILITNAGGPPAGRLDDFSDVDWLLAFQSTFLSHVRLIKAAKPLLARSSTPSILTVTSAAVKQPMENMILSNSIRSATVGMTKTLANELGPEGIRVNSILPGWTATERVQNLMSIRATQNNTSIDEELYKQAQASPLKRIGKPEEFARAAVFLVSPAASYITGVMLTVDGGLNKGLL